MSPPLRSEIVSIVFHAIDEVNAQLHLQVPKDAGVPLVGNDAYLDSLGFINFLASVEETLQDRLGVQLSLSEETADAGGRDRFTSVDALVEYILDRFTAK